MKSLMMGIFLLSVFIGNTFTGIVNSYIEIPSVEFAESGANVGHDGKSGTEDDLKKADGRIESAVAEQLKSVADRVEAAFAESGEFPASFDALPTDPWGNPIRYKRPHSGEARISSDGPDGEAGTRWDLGITLNKRSGEAEEGTWLHEKKVELGQLEAAADEGGSPLDATYTAGGGSKLEGAAYFWFFTKLMAITAILFVPYALLYRSRTYLQGDDEDETPEEEFEEEMESVAELR
jgi:POT family proton-dependent oligopeptide transporter